MISVMHPFYCLDDIQYLRYLVNIYYQYLVVGDAL